MQNEQGSEAWLRKRLGKVTASKIADMMAKTKTGWGASRANYAALLMVERLTGQPQESYSNAAMQWGTETEPQARIVYQVITDNMVEEVGFVSHPSISMSGASPDGLVGEDGLVEIKCPNSATHIETLLGQPIADKYIKQMQWQMACTGRKWCDWVSFDPRLPAELQIKIERIKRDEEMIAGIEKEVVIFLNEIDGKISALEAIRENV